MSVGWVYRRLCRVTEREIGRPINPHLFRDCSVTSRAIDDPNNILAMATLLGHANMRIVEMHDNQAESIEASRQYQGLIATRRREIVNRTKSRTRGA